MVRLLGFLFMEADAAFSNMAEKISQGKDALGYNGYRQLEPVAYQLNIGAGVDTVMLCAVTREEASAGFEDELRDLHSRSQPEAVRPSVARQHARIEAVHP